MKHILGLDVGTNSLGWYLLKIDSNRYSIVDRGVTIFPIGTIVDPVKGLEKTKHAQRRAFRLAARNRFRKKLRKKQLEQILKPLGFMPERLLSLEYEATYKVKGYQSAELYSLRAKALDKKIAPKELGRIFLLLNAYRGFKSSSKSVADKIEIRKDDESEVKQGIEDLRQALLRTQSRTYGEYFHQMHLKAKGLYEEGKWHNPNEPFDERALDENGDLILNRSFGIRKEHGRYTSRATYENEFDLIWRKQKEFYGTVLTGSKEEYDELKSKLKTETKEERRRLMNEFKQTLYWTIKYGCIYYQRPLKSPKKYIGRCQFEKNKRTAPVSSFLYQSFRIWKQLADVRFTDEQNNIYNEPLPHQWRKDLFDYLQTTPVVYLKSGKNKTGICELLNLNEKIVKFNFDNEENDKYIKGNTTYSALYTMLGKDVFQLLLQNKDEKGITKLEKLWHLVYMKKDDEWLSLTLNDPMHWPELSEDHIKELVACTFEEGYASYSSKALRKLLPYMEEGKDERTAQERVGYKESDEVFSDLTWQPSKKVSPIKSGELRNPVVEKAVTETIKLVNALLGKHDDINKWSWEIHVETTRELKKPKNEREKMRRDNRAVDEMREEYARFLNEQRKSGKLTGILKREIYKNDPIINKFELWLEMGGDRNDPEFESFIKVAQLDNQKRLKHQLWLECNRICPYTEKVISLTQLFSPEVEIEHIIPLSRSLDNSFANKTLTFSSVNKEKGNRTAYEFLKGNLRAFEHRLKKSGFPENKIKEYFLRESVPTEFTHAQIGNTSYIARFVRKKLQEVCKPHFVYFTNGKVTAELRNNDWRLGDVLDKIRFEEATTNDIDATLRRFAVVKKDFQQFYKQIAGEDCKLPKSQKDFMQIDERLINEYDHRTKNNLKSLLQEIDAFNAFRGAKGKKDRSDHRHHALDALITALCSPPITKQLSSLNAQREKAGISLFDSDGTHTRDKIDLPISYIAIKNSLRDILVLNKTNQRLMVSKKNKIKVRSNNSLPQKTKSIRASLHKDTYYGKLKQPSKQQIDKLEAFVTRFGNYVWNFTDATKLDMIYDRDLKEIIRRRILWFNENKIPITPEAYEQYPLFRYSPAEYPAAEPKNPISKKTGKPLPVVKKVRVVYKNYRSIIALPKNKYADADGNYIMALYELKETDKKGATKSTRDFRLLSTYEAVKRKTAGEKLFPDEVEKNGKILPLMEECPFLRQGDWVIMYETEEDKASINWENSEDLKTRLYVVSQLGSSVKKSGGKEYLFGNLRFVKHNISKNNAVYKGSDFSKDQRISFLENYHSQLKLIKVKMDALGKISKI